MKVIKIFLASSINEFKKERNELGRFILGVNNLNIEKGIYCHLELCENYDSSISARKRKQDDYNEFIKGSDAVFVLFCEKAGDYTVEELKLAKNCFRENGKPKVYTYFKNFDENHLTDEVRKAYELVKDEYKHFFGIFESIASIEVDILRVMYEIVSDDNLRLKEKDGILYIGYEPIMNINELDYIKNNRAITVLNEKITNLKNKNADFIINTFGYMLSEDELNDEISKSERDLNQKRTYCIDSLEKRFEKMSNATTFSHTLQCVMNAAAKGDYNSVKELLDLNDIKLSIQQKMLEKKIRQREIWDREYLELYYLIGASVQTEDDETTEEAFELIVDLIKTHHLYEEYHSCLGFWNTKYILEYLYYNRIITSAKSNDFSSLFKYIDICLKNIYELKVCETVAAEDYDSDFVLNMLGRKIVELIFKYKDNNMEVAQKLYEVLISAKGFDFLLEKTLVPAIGEVLKKQENV